MIYKASKEYNEKSRLRRSGKTVVCIVGFSTNQKSKYSAGYPGHFLIQPTSYMWSEKEENADADRLPNHCRGCVGDESGN